ncbi:hypothetical protein E8E15_006088 [Penicillium rubens]|nr:hypothetical protein E8E15_006088 [Penicillium rubens]
MVRDSSTLHKHRSDPISSIKSLPNPTSFPPTAVREEYSSSPNNPDNIDFVYAGQIHQPGHHARFLPAAVLRALWRPPTDSAIEEVAPSAPTRCCGWLVGLRRHLRRQSGG